MFGSAISEITGKSLCAKSVAYVGFYFLGKLVTFGDEKERIDRTNGFCQIKQWTRPAKSVAATFLWTA
jgi:hypothetical protein